MTLVNPALTVALQKSAPYLALLRPPSFTRLEPQSVTGDPATGLAMPVADPLWLLHRQWQFGEFIGEDAGSAVDVSVSATAHRLTSWRPGPPGGDEQPWSPLDDLLEPTVEREPAVGGALLRPRADAAAVLVAVLRAAGHGGVVGDVVDNAPLVAPAPVDPYDAGTPRLMSLIGPRLPDAETVAAALEAAAPDLPPWLPADPSLATALADWLAFYREDVAPPPVTDESWVTDRLEYAFAAAGVGTDGTSVVLEADEHLGGPVEWHSFDLSTGAVAAAVTTAEPVPLVSRTLATRLRYPGMPANRLWEFEDAAVNLGSVSAEPHDLPRMLLIEYAMTAGTDWLVVAMDAPHGSVTRIDDLTYTTVFGESYRVQPAGAAIRGDGWRMFNVTSATPPEGPAQPLAPRTELMGLVIPPALLEVAESPPIEDVIFFRDETANLVWAVERTVTAASGDARSRRVEPSPEPSRTPGSVSGVELDYSLLTTVPAGWVPFVPAPGIGARAVDVLRARLGDVPDGAVGQLLASPRLVRLRDGEVPREGVAVRRVTALARRGDGSYVRWVTRRVSTGLGEGSSGLAYDSALPHS
jgi:hypothetical protein